MNIGTNPNLRAPAGTRLDATPLWGMVSIMTGDTSWAGGSDVSSWNFIGFVPAATVTVDGKTVVDKGQLMAVPPEPTSARRAGLGAASHPDGRCGDETSFPGDPADAGCPCAYRRQW